MIDPLRGRPELARLRRGVEKESLRVTPTGALAPSAHPAAFGSALTHPHITTDFSEAQLELITCVHDSAEACITELEDIHRFVYRHLDEELLWAASMPCILADEADIPVGRYGTSNVGRSKTVYRIGLDHRYGALMQTISGIHYNFSVPDTLWPAVAAARGESLEDETPTRAYFDLIGLPPAPDEVEEFVRDSSAAPFRELVDRLLTSPHYGERWGRHWLDAARFGESLGAHEGDNAIREEAYRYRDAVIRAFNDDLPYDEFVSYQVAGAPKSIPATRQDLGMFVQLGTSLSKTDNPNDRKFHRLDDMVSATGQAFLALTVGCARCHDHKIDPITAEEYYQLTAVFFDEAEVKPDAGGKYVPLELTTPHLLAAGSWRRPVKPVEPGFLRVLMRDGRSPTNWRPRPEATDGVEAQFEPSKLGMLANWLTDVEHGAGALLARVIVNRLWQHHFGRGIVSTPNDFGKLGTEPTHPALLDWLASQLIREGWQLKPIHRLIMNSAVYKQAAGTNLAQARHDAYNEYLWHRRPVRMEAEVIRDHILSVSGSLRTNFSGPSTPIGDRKTPFNDTPDTWHRSIYLMSPRFHLHPVLKIFDPPDNTQSIGLRDVSTTPSSTAFMLNAPFVWEQARRFAQRVQDRAGGDPGLQIESVYRIALSRPPTAEEREIGLSFLGQPSTGGLEAGTEPESMDGPSPLAQYCHAVMGLNEFIYVH